MVRKKLDPRVWGREGLWLGFLLLGLLIQPVEATRSNQAVMAEVDDPVTIVEENDRQIILSFNSPDFEIGRKRYGQLEFDQVNLRDATTAQARSGYRLRAHPAGTPTRPAGRSRFGKSRSGVSRSR